MEEETIPILSYAAGPPRPMRNKAVIAAAGVAGVIAVGACAYRAANAPASRLPGSLPAVRTTWTLQGKETTSGKESKASEEAPGAATQPEGA